MSDYRLFIAVAENGLRVPMILDAKDRLPLLLPLRWVIWERLGRRDTLTITADLRAVSLLYQYSKTHGLDLENRFSSASIFSMAEIKGFARWLRSRKEGRSLGRETYNQYLARVGDFAGWVTTRAHAFSTNIDQARFATKAGTEISRLFASEKVTGKSRKEHLGLNKHDTANLLCLLEPDNRQNPFAEDTAFANMVMVRLLLESGMRRGELLSLRVDDITINGSEALLCIVDRPDPKDDPRRVAPSVKTLERIIPLSIGMAHLLARYERRVRRGAQNPFLFVSPRFKTPLSSNQVTNVFAALEKRGGFNELTPHTLRRTFNDRFLETARELGIDEITTQRVQTWICGWSEQSQMPQLYAQREIRERAWMVLQKLQQGFYR
jgi:integrase